MLRILYWFIATIVFVIVYNTFWNDEECSEFLDEAARKFDLEFLCGQGMRTLLLLPMIMVASSWPIVCLMYLILYYYAMESE